MLETIDHINIVVRDLPAMEAFYVNALGFAVSKRATIRGEWISRIVALQNAEANVVYLDLESGPRVELLEYVAPVGTTPSNIGLANTMGLRHMAFRVKDIEAAAARLKSAGVNLLSDIQTVPVSQVTYAGGVQKRLVYFHDPEQNLLELCEYRTRP